MRDSNQEPAYHILHAIGVVLFSSCTSSSTALQCITDTLGVLLLLIPSHGANGFRKLPRSRGGVSTSDNEIKLLRCCLTVPV